MLSDEDRRRIELDYAQSVDNYECLLESSPPLEEVLPTTEAREALHKGCPSVPTNAHRERFVHLLLERHASGEIHRELTPGQLVSMKDLLGAKGVKAYHAAIKEELESVAFRDAVLRVSTERYPGKPWTTPIDVYIGGASATGKSYARKFFVEEAAAIIGVVDTDEETGNLVVGIDGGIEREMSQIRKLVIQIALESGYDGVSGLKDRIKIKKHVEAAAKMSAGLSIVNINTFTSMSSWGWEKIVKSAIASEERQLVFCNVTANQRTARHQGESRAFGVEVESDRSLILPNQLPSRLPESKKYNGRYFWFGEWFSNKAMKTYKALFESGKARSICLTMHNDRLLTIFNDENVPITQKPKEVERVNISAGQSVGLLSSEKFSAWQARKTELEEGEESVLAGAFEYQEFSDAYDKMNARPTIQRAINGSVIARATHAALSADESDDTDLSVLHFQAVPEESQENATSSISMLGRSSELSVRTPSDLRLHNSASINMSLTEDSLREFTSILDGIQNTDTTEPLSRPVVGISLDQIAPRLRIVTPPEAEPRSRWFLGCMALIVAPIWAPLRLGALLISVIPGVRTSETPIWGLSAFVLGMESIERRFVSAWRGRPMDVVSADSVDNHGVVPSRADEAIEPTESRGVNAQVEIKTREVAEPPEYFKVEGQSIHARR